MSDIHVDQQYAAGSSADCGEPLCCRSSHSSSNATVVGAGYWGDYGNCDIPMRTLTNLLNHLSKNEEVCVHVVSVGVVSVSDETRN